MIRFLVSVLTLVLVVPSAAYATCSCMFRRMPPPSVTQQSDLTRDPSYNPDAAVFLVRDGTRTVLTMEASYDGPAEEVTLVIPIPESIERNQVRTVPGSLFRNLDRRTAPRVRHVWPSCRRPSRRPMARSSADGLGGAVSGGGRIEALEQEYSIDIEDEWEVDEYDITLLGAAQSAGLLRYLRDQQSLDLPAAADAVLRAYIETDHRFVIAKADPSRAHVLGGKMMLSPIQLEYSSTELRVPVRLGTLNSPGEQELLLYVLANDGRYEIANRPAMVAPTDLRMRPDARGTAAELYAGMMDELFRQRPGAVVTEFAHTLGSKVGRNHVRRFGIPTADEEVERSGRRTRWTLTRLRHRYGKDLDDDLTLRPAATPLRMTRRWSTPDLRTWAPRGESGYHVQFVVEHRGRTCPSTAQQQRYARSWATAESMWEKEDDVWPGQVLLDPVPSLGIEPNSSAPPGWPPPPVVAAVPDRPPANVGGGVNQMSTMAFVPNLQPAPAQSTPAAAPASDDGFCSTGGSTSGGWLALVVALGLVFRRRPR